MSGAIIIEPFHKNDVAAFLKLASGENWVSGHREFDFLLSAFPQGCFCARNDSGEAVGFVTALRHEQSGWIGNLIVDGPFRGKGRGETLFVSAFGALRESGAETVWLTASSAGQALYEKYGFRTVDTVIRWVATGRLRHRGHTRSSSGSETESALLTGIDCQTWGDRREALLAETAGRGRVLRGDGGFAVIQEFEDVLQLGPFSALNSSTAEQLVDEALRTVKSGSKVYIDTPASNRAALRLFNRRRMRISGSNELMYAGVRPDYKPELLYGLATMGSCG